MPGRHFLQVPGPTNIPDRILRAMDRPVVDHRGADFPILIHEIVAGLRRLFQTTHGEIVLFPGSGTGGWEASLVNTLSPGDRVLSFNMGFFSQQYAACARRFGVDVDEVDLPWGGEVPPSVVHDRLTADRDHRVKAVLIAHNETSTGVTSDVSAIRQAIDGAGHPALLLVDAVSALGSLPFSFDDWGVDVAVTGTQKGLMLPPGMAVLCVSPRAVAAGARATLPRFFFDWRSAIEDIHNGYFPYTPATLLLYGLREALRILEEEGLPAVFERHRRLAGAVRGAVEAMGFSLLCRNPSAQSDSLTAVAVPDGTDADSLVRAAEQHLSLSLGRGLGRLKGRIFRIGHLGSLNELETLATIAGVEMAAMMAGFRITLGSGVAAAQNFLMDRRLTPAAG